MNLRLIRQSKRSQTFQKVHAVWFPLYKTLENTNYKPVYRKTADQSLVAWGSVKLEVHKETYGDDGHTHYHYCHDGFMGAYVCQLNCVI